MNQTAIDRYESALTDVLSVRYAYSFWKGRVAFYAILRALDIGPGDEVILPGFTCVAVPNAVRFAGATPVYADIQPGGYNLDPLSVERAVTPRTRALLVQHTFGIPACLDKLLAIAQRKRLDVIEDCTHTLGSTYRGQPVGTFGTAAFFSSQWSKPYTTGLGGVAITANSALAGRLKRIQSEFTHPSAAHLVRLRLQYALYRCFFSPRLYWLAMGVLHRLSRWSLFVGSSSAGELNGEVPRDTNWRMSSFQGRAGLKQLGRVPQDLDHRRRLAELYANSLRVHGWQPDAIPEQADTVYLRYPVRVANKWELLRRAAAAKIELGSWFESVLHPRETPLERLGYRQGLCPVAEQTAQEVVNLPLHPRISESEALRINDFVQQVAQRPSFAEAAP